MEWKEKFLKSEKSLIGLGSDGFEILDGVPKIAITVNTDKLLRYIKTEIIEKIIEDMYLIIAEGEYRDRKERMQQLKSKWGGVE